jgi:chitodextrinase
VYVDAAKVQTTSQTAATVPSLACGTAGYFEVDAYDAAGNRSSRAGATASTAACGDTQAPSAPGSVLSTSRTATSIALVWTASSDNVGVTGYGLYRNGAAAGTTSGTTGIFSGLSCNTNYTLSVDAYDGAANRSTKTTVMVATTACADTTAPSAPANLAASNITQSSVSLSWGAATDNVGVTGYDVFRNGTKMATVTSTSAGQTGLACGTSFTFGVEALDAAGNRSARTQLTAATVGCTAPAPVPPPPSGSKLTWAPPALTSPETIVAAGNRARLQSLDPTKDYIIKVGDLRQAGGISIRGGRNVVIIGGRVRTPRVTDSYESVPMRVDDTRGEVFIEGVHFDGVSEKFNDAIVLNCPLATVTVQNVRIEGLEGVTWHADVVQSWGGVKLFRSDRFTGISNYHGFMLSTDVISPYQGRVMAFDFRRTNLRNYGDNFVFFQREAKDSIRLEDVWFDPHPSSWDVRNLVYPWAFAKGVFSDPWGRDPLGHNASLVGGVVSWPSTSGITGSARFGNPPGGDFVSQAAAGVNYVSPGYN